MRFLFSTGPVPSPNVPSRGSRLFKTKPQDSHGP
jgi:hypothetical protein